MTCDSKQAGGTEIMDVDAHGCSSTSWLWHRFNWSGSRLLGCTGWFEFCFPKDEKNCNVPNQSMTMYEWKKMGSRIWPATSRTYKCPAASVTLLEQCFTTRLFSALCL